VEFISAKRRRVKKRGSESWKFEVVDGCWQAWRAVWWNNEKKEHEGIVKDNTKAAGLTTANDQ